MPDLKPAAGGAIDWQRVRDEALFTRVRDCHPLIRGLFETMPTPGAVWPVEQRDRWHQAARMIFNLLYQEEP
jgi:hypothetical protein